MKSLIKRFAAVVLITAVPFAIAACNTTKGVGKDMEKAGEGIQGSAEKHGAE